VCVCVCVCVSKNIVQGDIRFNKIIEVELIICGVLEMLARSYVVVDVNVVYLVVSTVSRGLKGEGWVEVIGVVDALATLAALAISAGG
jgi:hypothetical protein